MLRIFTAAAAETPPCPFHNGDRVFLARGSYQGTTGIFLNLRDDPKWADVREPDASVRRHPVEWMREDTRV